MIENISHRAEALEIDRFFGIFFKIFSKSHHEIVNGSRLPSENELEAARFQGKHVAAIAMKLSK